MELIITGGQRVNRIAVTWLALGVIYGTFFSWYTAFGGPLTSEEITRYLAFFAANGADAERIEQLRTFMEEDTGDDFVMVNVIDLYETPVQIEGVAPGESSSEVLNKYMAYMYPALFRRACHPVLFGRVASSAMDLMNAEGMSRWTTGAAMRYRSRRDMLEITTNPAFAGSHDFKVAAMRKTIAFPIDPWFQLGDPRLLLALLLGVIGSTASWILSTRTQQGSE